MLCLEGRTEMMRDNKVLQSHDLCRFIFTDSSAWLTARKRTPRDKGPWSKKTNVETW